MHAYPMLGAMRRKRSTAMVMLRFDLFHSKASLASQQEAPQHVWHTGIASSVLDDDRSPLRDIKEQARGTLLSLLNLLVEQASCANSW